MNELQITNHHGRYVIDSRDVAEMVDKQHKHLLRDIEGYTEILSQSNFGLTDFFIPHTYTDSQNKPRPCFLITRKGCDMVANKMTGEKGVLFTAAYVTKFEEMEQKQKPSCIEDLIIMQAQALKDVRTEVTNLTTTTQQITGTIQTIKESILDKPKEEWRDWVNDSVRKVCGILNRGYQEMWDILYKQLEADARCNLNRRVINAKQRMAEEGVTKSKRRKYCKLSAIEDDAKLKRIFTNIIERILIKAS